MTRLVQHLSQLFADIIEWQKKTTLLFIQVIEAFIGGNSVDPSEETGILSELMDVFVHFDEYFLH